MKILFVDNLSPSALTYIALRGRSIETIWHFDPLQPFSNRLLQIYRKMGLIHADFKEVNCNIGQVRDDQGKGEYIGTLSDLRNICTRIKKKYIEKDPILSAMGSIWSKKKVSLYFDKRIEKEIKPECLRISLVKWMITKGLGKAPSQCALLIEKRKWFFSLKAYAKSKGIRLIGYNVFVLERVVKIVCSFRSLHRRVWLKLLMRLKYSVHKRIRKHSHGTKEETKGGKQSINHRIAIRYTHKTFGLDPSERSEFFWFRYSGIPYSDILLYDYSSIEKHNIETSATLNELRIRSLGRRSDLITPRMLIMLLRTVMKLVSKTVLVLTKNRWVSPYVIRGLLKLSLDYAFWFEVFSRNRVRVNVGIVRESVGKSLALDSLNGVNFSYQYSSSNILSPTANLSGGEDVQFVFSDMFEKLWRNIDAPAEVFVRTGFIYDHSIYDIKGNMDFDIIKKRLQDNGARFIICFFDENSSNRWDALYSNKTAAEDYVYLLKWLFEDQTIGLVFKPKIYRSLRERFSQILSLFDQAERTGRCWFTESENIMGSVYPARAAAISDICIGKLVGGTAAIEAQLSGVPAVLIDSVSFRERHPFYVLGRDRFVFDNWDSLRPAIEQYRDDPQKRPEFGNWMPFLKELDPFRDGQASYRMALYIRWIYDILKDGGSKETALKAANEKFRRKWSSAFLSVNG